jgi:hypothetical protein
VARFVLHTVDVGPQDLLGQLPVHATIVGRLAGADRDDYWCARLDAPLKYHLPAGFDRDRATPTALADDQDGPLLWVDQLVVCSHLSGTQLHSGMTNLAVNIAYVIDSSLCNEDRLDMRKIDYVAVGEIDDAPRTEESSHPPPSPDPAAEVESSPAPSPDPAAEVEPSPWDAIISETEFAELLDGWVVKLAAVAGENPRYVPEPLGVHPSGVFYRIASDELSYQAVKDDETLWARTTVDPNELVYWIISDVAVSIARRRNREPAAGRYRPPWVVDWHGLMHTLSPEWGLRTQARIDAMAQDERYRSR